MSAYAVVTYDASGRALDSGYKGATELWFFVLYMERFQPMWRVTVSPVNPCACGGLPGSCGSIPAVCIVRAGASCS